MRRESPTETSVLPGESGQLFDSKALAAFFSYATLSCVFFGRSVFANPAGTYIGRGPDPQQYIWFIEWWAYAISHRLNPFTTAAVWVKCHVNLSWATDFPLASFILYPITRTWGPITAANVLHLIAPAIAGWSAFVLCRYAARRFWPAWIGGSLFAFSPYMLSGMVGSVFLLLVFPVPLGVWATLRRASDEITEKRYIAVLGLLLVALFLFSPEIFATSALFGGIAFCIAHRSSTPYAAAKILSTAWSSLKAYVISGVLLLPYIYLMFASAVRHGEIFSPWLTSIDLLNFIFPTITNQLGALKLCGKVAYTFRSNLSECSGYLGAPLLIIILLYAKERRRDTYDRILLYSIIAVCVMAMGPVLEIAGYRLLPLPAGGLDLMPLLNKAMPARFMLYAYLGVSVMLAKWLSAESGNSLARWTLGSTAILLMLPNLSTTFWTTTADIPEFFSKETYRRYLSPQETVMVLPFGIFGEGMLWQAVSKMYFRMAGGYVGFAPAIPQEDSGWPILRGLLNVAGVPDAAEQFKAYLAAHHVGAIILGPNQHYLSLRLAGQPTAAIWIRRPPEGVQIQALDALVGSLGVPPVKTGGITLYLIDHSALTPYAESTATEMEAQALNARFGALLIGAEAYLAHGYAPDDLTPQALERARLVPLNWFGGSPFPDHRHTGNPVFHAESVLNVRERNIEIGLEGSYAAVKPLIDRYGPQARGIFFPYPKPAGSGPVPDSSTGMIVMEFDRAGLSRASEIAASNQRVPPQTSRAYLNLTAPSHPEHRAH